MRTNLCYKWLSVKSTYLQTEIKMSCRARKREVFQIQQGWIETLGWVKNGSGKKCQSVFIGHWNIKPGNSNSSILKHPGNCHRWGPFPAPRLANFPGLSLVSLLSQKKVSAHVSEQPRWNPSRNSIKLIGAGEERSVLRASRTGPSLGTGTGKADAAGYVVKHPCLRQWGK